MADVNLSIDSSDILVILDALELKRASLNRSASKKMAAAQAPLKEQIERLISIFKSAAGHTSDAPPTRG